MTPAAAERLAARFAEQPEQSGLFTDFDGTLSPIVSRAEDAAPLAGTVESLATLARFLARVAVVSGRPASFLARRLAPAAEAGVELYGLHGLEHVEGSAVAPLPEATAWIGAVSEACRRAEAAAIPGLAIEDKTYSVTLHWRRAADPAATGSLAARLARRLADEHGLVLRPGKASLELVPPLPVDKGTVVERLGRGLAFAAFLGDDLGDVRAFEALASLAGGGTAFARVAVAGPEAPEALLENADVVLSGPEEAARLLREIELRLSAR